MNKKTFLTALLIASMSFGAFSCASPIDAEKGEANINEISQAEDPTPLTVKDVADYLSEKKAHYPLSDEFIERYQQTSGGYIDYAKKLGLLVDREQHEPNQKWHFFTSWLQQSLDDGSITYDADAKKRVYNGLLCPELLLWIYEATEVEPVKVKAAKEAAEQGKVAGTAVATIAKNMRGCVPWEDIENNVRNGKKDDPIVGVPSAIDLSVGNTKKITPMLIEGGALTYISENPDIATIGLDGTITAISDGETAIEIVSADNPDIKKRVNVVVANHGNEEAPISIDEAYSLASKVCLLDGETTNEPICAYGKAKDNSDAKGSFSLAGTENEIFVSGSTFGEGVNDVAQNDDVVLTGAVLRSASSLEFAISTRVIKNTRGASIVSLKNNPNVLVYAGEDLWEGPLSLTNGTSFSFSVSPLGEFEVTKVMAVNETLEAVDGVYSFDVRGNVEVSISAKNPSVVGSIAKYDVSYSLGDRKTAKAFASKEEIMDSLVKVEGENLITSCDEYELMYGGANGGSGETVWKLENVMKFGSTSANGNLTLSLGQEVNRVVLTGYVYASTCDVRIGDSSSSDWGDTGADNKTTKVRCSDMVIASKETVEAGEMSQITIDFESTRTLKIATTNKKPLFLASIEFVYHDGE